MYDHSGNCFRLNIDANSFSPQRDNAGGGVFEAIGPVRTINLSGDYAGVTVTPIEIYFDGLGNVISGGCAGAAFADDPVELTINPFNLQLEVFSTGYIRAI